MPDDKKDSGVPLEQGGTVGNERVADLLQAICVEMSDLTPEELERLYAAIALMGLEQDG